MPSTMITNSKRFQEAIDYAFDMAEKNRHQFLTPEHMLYAITQQAEFQNACSMLNVDFEGLADKLYIFIMTFEPIPKYIKYSWEISDQMTDVFKTATESVESAQRNVINPVHAIVAILNLNDSMARFLLETYVDDKRGEFLQSLITCYEISDNDADENIDEDFKDYLANINDENDESAEESSSRPWRELVCCLNDTYQQHNPLIGRTAELERTIQVLCRRDKNNPLHVGEPGVGKTALVYGLTAMIERDEVPERLKGAKVYMMDIGSMVAGTQFRGDFEKRMKMVMDGLAKETHAILYIDEIHNLVGAGRNGEGALDASNMIKPYLEDGSIRFIGSTTYDEYNRHIAQHKSLVRRFQQIDIAEPSTDDAINIIKGLLNGYEHFHGVKYSADAAEYAVHSTARFITDRFLPDKAIDLIDEAGAWRETHPLTNQKRQTIDRQLLSNVLAKMCKIDASVLKSQDNTQLQTLNTDIKDQIYGQDTAVDKVVEAVQLAKAGLTDETKPMASLLFVGPTGVGKTEIAKVLAEKLGIHLVRFDMSEYAEKHAVAKLIGSPAGYVGYEDGGLLTAAIRKSPNCVLLFDEIEKAHPDIYNIFLQIMDYASLCDNRGQRADFRNVIIIMTSNAGAQYASRANIGFTGNMSRGDAMLTQVKKTFKPEFINRLSDIVVFNDMDEHMASLILDKCIGRLSSKLASKNVTLQLDDEARNLLLSRGFTKEYGAREIERVVASMLKPLLMREILFGKLKKGGCAKVTAQDSKLQLC